MTEKNKVEGKVSRITAWKTGKGYFLNLDANSNDFYGFGSCKGEVGCFVELEVSEGTGNFSDKIKIDKMHSKQTVKEAVKETADKDLKIVEDSIKSGENTYFARQNLIIRQTCIKSASAIVAGSIQGASITDTKRLFVRVSDLAESMYAWVTESDQKLPEPPEEP